MGQSIYFDFNFNNSIDKINNMYYIPNYSRNKKIISREELFEPLKLLSHYIPENVRDVFDAKEINAVLTPLHMKKESYDNGKKEIVFKGFVFREEHKRSFAYFLGSIFSRLVSDSSSFEVELPIKDESGNEKLIQFSLDSEYFDKEMFFGYLFEYLYLVEKEKYKEKYDVGCFCNSPETYKKAFNLFITKHLSEFAMQARSYKEKKIEYKEKLANGSNEQDDSISQDASSTLQDAQDSPADLRFRSKLATFDKVIRVIRFGLSSKQNKEFFANCLSKRKQDDKRSIVEPASYGLIIDEFEKNYEQKDSERKKEKRRRNLLDNLVAKI